MRFSIQPSLIGVVSARRILLAAVIYSLVILPTKALLMLLLGAEVRFAACLPVILGMLWGPAGALGVAAGNFIGDFVSGEALYVCALGAVCNFIMAYLPYRLWYAGGRRPELFIHDTRSFWRFLLILLVTVSIFAVMLTGIVLLMGSPYPLDSFFIFFSTNFDFSLILGVPTLYFLRGHRTNFLIPPLGAGSSRYQLAALGTALVLALGFLIMAAERPEYGVRLAPIFLVVCIALLLYACTIPCKFDSALIAARGEVAHSLGTAVTGNFLCLSIVCLIFVFISILLANPFLAEIISERGFWDSVFKSLFLSINFIFFCAMYIIQRTEKEAIRPLQELTASVRDFVSTDYLKIPQIENAAGTAAAEILELSQAFDKMTVDLQHYIDNLGHAIAEKETLESQLRIASQIQQSMLGDTAAVNARLRNYHVTAGMFPAREVGGDFYDCFFIDDDHLALVTADVVGKGVPAALFMMTAKTLLKSHAHSTDPGRILTLANDTLSENNQSNMFVTVWLGILRLSDGRLIYANGGHNYPLLRENDAEPVALSGRSGPALGVLKERRYKNYIVSLPRCSKLLVYTDGVTEAENPRGEFFGSERLAQHFKRNHIPDDILFAVQEFAEGHEQSDDITVLWVERN